jgi:hypothetical protein
MAAGLVLGVWLSGRLPEAAGISSVSGTSALLINEGSIVAFRAPGVGLLTVSGGDVPARRPESALFVLQGGTQ